MTNLVYFGSPDFSAKILQTLLSPSKLEGEPRTREGGDKEGVHFRVVGVITSPDKPRGRKQVLTPSPVAQLASKYDLPVFKPTKLDDTNLAHLKLLKPDIFLVVSYGKIIPKPWLTSPTIGTFNLHFSLLPKYRGALCISEAIKNQDSQTGVTLMVMDEGMDTGSIISQEKVSIDINDNCETLTNKLTQSGIKLLTEYLPLLAIRHSPFAIRELSHPQHESQATYTPITKSRTRQSAFIPWSDIQPCLSNEQSSMSNERCLRLHALIRSLNPDPGAWTRVSLKEKGKSKKEIEIKIIKTSLKCHPGLDPGSIQIDSGSEAGMTLDIVQLPGKTPISWQQFHARTNLPQDFI